MKKHLLLIIAVVSIGFTVFGQATQINKVVTNLSAERFRAIIGNDKKGVILDLRTTDEMSKGFIKGAVQLDFLAKDAEKQIDKLDKTKTYYIYCASGGRSADVAQYMADNGFKSVYNLEKGFTEWQKKEFPVEMK